MIREEAARKLARQLLSNSIVRVKIDDRIIDMVARVIMTAVAIDEQRQRSEKILGRKL